MNVTFNDRIKQVTLLALLISLIWMVIQQLIFCLPGLLGAVTLYILSRANYFQLVYKKKWKRGRAAGLFLLYYFLLLGLPLFLTIMLIGPKVNELLSNPAATIDSIKHTVYQVQQNAGITIVSEKSLSDSLDKLTAFIPTLLNSTANLITNLAIMLFFLYYMLYYGSKMEKTLYRIIPLKDINTTLLASETKKLVKANALSIPLISLVQGLTATLGYFIFGVQEWALWGFLTGIFAFLPVAGTLIIWIPLVIYTYMNGNSGMAIGLLLYNLLVTGNMGHLARITIMRKLGKVNPVITITGIIVGLGLFGFIGLIFGPLLVNYIIVLFKIYMNEFVEPLAEELKAAENNTTNTENKNIANPTPT